MAFDLTYLLILNANLISANSLLLGFNLVTHFNLLLLKIILSLSCIKNELSKFLIDKDFLNL